MIVSLVVPTHKISQNMPVYKRLIDSIHAAGHSIARNWIEPAYYRPELFEDPETTHTRFEEDILKSLEQSDAVIADVSERGTFGTGYLVAMAQQQKLPILLLHKQGTEKGMLPSAIRSEYLSYAEFDNVATLNAAVDEFLGRVRG